MKRSVIIESSDIEDATSQAGWLYTDLLLALMVVFLATISFIPAQLSPSKSLTNASNSNKSINLFKNSENTLTLTIRNRSQVDLTSKIQKYLLGLGNDPKKTISLIQVIGGYDAKSETASDGIVTAMSYASKIRSTNPKLYSIARSTLSSSEMVPSGQAIVRLTFDNI